MSINSHFTEIPLVNVTDSMPFNLQTIHTCKLSGVSGDDFIAYVVCPSCQSVSVSVGELHNQPFRRFDVASCCSS